MDASQDATYNTLVEIREELAALNDIAYTLEKLVDAIYRTSGRE